ncbi:RBBP9/YdeN family alpha/beta hydrolase [Flavobacterium algicola]|uniref:RBBP9/YdeN family alpha/beta hydrolase n=1 Tax=Flavobacterium algicola TaxID=556529 RepID=UPI001EFE63C4|nr:alpha/beta hydrolase [Flavobacterium algicola]MCG9791116.1 alpha/beta hydrolase [Flavobacterium algicola]
MMTTERNDRPNLLIVPGLGGSGAEHWQQLWHNDNSNSIIINQSDWDKPILKDWLDNLNQTIESLTQPTLLIGHSLGSILITIWANQHYNDNIIGALIVAPADVDSAEHTPDIIRDFAPIPLQKLKFPSLVITSTNDPYVSVERATFFSEKWGSDFVSIGLRGHINTLSNLGQWDEGKELLSSFINKLKSN